MKKKITHSVLFVAVLAGTTALTLFAGRGNLSSTIYNFVFLAVIAVLYLIAMFGGMFRMNNLSTAFHRAVEELNSMFKTPGKTDPRNLTYLGELFDDKYLDQKMDSFTDSINNSKEGLGDIEEFINEDELDIHVHKKLLEMVPDIFTSLGILGTFLGLVWGLRDFQPTDYSAMTSSVEALVEGIKVAFLTSIYGISFSIIYTFGMKGEYSSMTEELQGFLEKFHSYVMPTAENESRNLLLASQKLQTSAMKQMAEQFTAQMEDFAQYQRLSYKTMEQVRKLLSEVTAANTRDVSLIASGRNDSVEKLGNLIAQQNEGQQALLEEINKNMKELSKAAQKGKFGLFR